MDAFGIIYARPRNGRPCIKLIVDGRVVAETHTQGDPWPYMHAALDRAAQEMERERNENRTPKTANA